MKSSVIDVLVENKEVYEQGLPSEHPSNCAGTAHVPYPGRGTGGGVQRTCTQRFLFPLKSVYNMQISAEKKRQTTVVDVDILTASDIKCDASDTFVHVFALFGFEHQHHATVGAANAVTTTTNTSATAMLLQIRPLLRIRTRLLQR